MELHRLPNNLYNANVCQQVPHEKTKTEAAQYKAKMATEALAHVPIVGRVLSFTCGYMQLEAMNNKLDNTDSWKDRFFIVVQMAGTAGLIGLSVLSPRAAGAISGFTRSFTNMKALIEDLQNGDLKAVALDAFRMGSNVVYMCAMVSGNPVFIAVSLVAQGAENIVEGGNMLIKQWNAKEKDWMVIGLAGMQVGLGALRGYQGASIGARYAMAKTHKPSENRLENEQKVVTGELTQEQLDQVNKHFDSTGVDKLIYVKLDENGNVVKASTMSSSQPICGSYQHHLTTDWEVHAPNDATLRFHGQTPCESNTNNPTCNSFDWNRPEGNISAIKTLRGHVRSVDLEQFPDYLDWDLKARADSDWFITQANQDLSEGIQKSLAGQTEDVWQHFLSYTQELGSQFFGAVVSSQI